MLAVWYGGLAREGYREMNVWLLVIIGAIVLVVGTIICVGWWKLADRFFPGVSRKTGQNVRILKEEEEKPDRHAGATVIKGFDRPSDGGKG